MARLIVHRLFAAIPTLFVVSLAAFLLIELVPGDAAITLAGDNASPDRVEEIREQLGLNDPWIPRYVDWASGAVRGDFGESLFSGQPISEAITQRMPQTISIALVALVFALLVGGLSGVIAGVRPNTKLDHSVRLFSSASVALPSYFVALVLILLLSIRFTVLPAVGYVGITESPVEWIKHLILPGIALGLATSAVIGRQLRNSMIETMQQDYVQTARAAGASESNVALRQALRNASIPAVTVTGTQVAHLLGGVIVIERVFGIAGLGDLTANAVMSRDIPLIQGVVMTTTIIVIVCNLAVDVGSGVLNPRLRAS